MDHLGFVEAVDGLGEGIVVAVADAADRGLDACLSKPLGILDRDVLGGFNGGAAWQVRRRPEAATDRRSTIFVGLSGDTGDRPRVASL
jgi:hypothetical protein